MKTFYNKLALLISFLLFTILFSYAQTVHWAKSGVSQGFDNGNAMVSDDSGNVYISGQIEYSAVFDSYTLNSHGIHDILVAKYSTSGEIKWIKGAGGTRQQEAAAVDENGNIYISGYFNDDTYVGSNHSIWYCC